MLNQTLENWEIMLQESLKNVHSLEMIWSSSCEVCEVEWLGYTLRMRLPIRLDESTKKRLWPRLVQVAKKIKGRIRATLEDPCAGAYWEKEGSAEGVQFRNTLLEFWTVIGRDPLLFIEVANPENWTPESLLNPEWDFRWEESNGSQGVAEMARKIYASEWMEGFLSLGVEKAGARWTTDASLRNKENQAPPLPHVLRRKLVLKKSLAGVVTLLSAVVLGGALAGIFQSAWIWYEIKKYCEQRGEFSDLYSYEIKSIVGPLWMPPFFMMPDEHSHLLYRVREGTPKGWMEIQRDILLERANDCLNGDVTSVCYFEFPFMTQILRQFQMKNKDLDSLKENYRNWYGWHHWAVFSKSYSISDILSRLDWVTESQATVFVNDSLLHVMERIAKDSLLDKAITHHIGRYSHWNTELFHSLGSEAFAYEMVIRVHDQYMQNLRACVFPEWEQWERPQPLSAPIKSCAKQWDQVTSFVPEKWIDLLELRVPFVEWRLHDVYIPEVTQWNQLVEQCQGYCEESISSLKAVALQIKKKMFSENHDIWTAWFEAPLDRMIANEYNTQIDAWIQRYCSHANKPEQKLQHNGRFAYWKENLKEYYRHSLNDMFMEDGRLYYLQQSWKNLKVEKHATPGWQAASNRIDSIRAFLLDGKQPKDIQYHYKACSGYNTPAQLFLNSNVINIPAGGECITGWFKAWEDSTQVHFRAASEERWLTPFKGVWAMVDMATDKKWQEGRPLRWELVVRSHQTTDRLSVEWSTADGNPLAFDASLWELDWPCEPIVDSPYGGELTSCLEEIHQAEVNERMDALRKEGPDYSSLDEQYYNEDMDRDYDEQYNEDCVEYDECEEEEN